MEAAHLADSWKMGWKMFAYTWHWRAMSNRVFGQTRGTGERFQTECLDRHVAPESDVNPSVWTDTWHGRTLSNRVFRKRVCVLDRAGHCDSGVTCNCNTGSSFYVTIILRHLPPVMRSAPGWWDEWLRLYDKRVDRQ